jgi:hypothetical protein
MWCFAEDLWEYEGESDDFTVIEISDDWTQEDIDKYVHTQI